MAVKSSAVQGVQDRVPAGGALCLRAVLRAAGGRLRPQPHEPRRRRAAPPDPGRPAEHLALRRLPAARGRASRPLRPARLARRAAGRLHPADPRRPAGRAARPARGVGQERRRQPDPLVQGPRRLGRRRAGTRARLRDDRVRLDRQPRELRRRPRRGAGLDSYVFIPRDLEEQKILATGIYGTNLVGVNGNYDDVNRLCTELCGRARLGIREHQPAPLLRRGLEDARLRDRRAARLGAARPLRRARRLGLAVHEDRRGLSRNGSSSGCSSGTRCRG